MDCTVCRHPISEHTGRDGECRHDYEPYIAKPKEQCLCVEGKRFNQKKEKE